MSYKSRILMLSALLSAGVAVPALADWDSIGSVYINHRPNRDTKFVRLGGSVERLSVRPDSSNVTCQSIRVTFNNGRTSDVFRGNLYEDRSKDLDLPGYRRNISRIEFNCVSWSRRGTKLDLQADIGRYRDEWRRDRDWSGVWSRMFSWANYDRDHDRDRDRDADRDHDRDRDRDADRDHDRDRDRVADRDHDRDWNRDRDIGRNWSLLSTESFSGRDDRETVNTPARNITRIALKADRDARCDYVRVSFDNGMTRDLGDVSLDDNHYVELDLPGERRDVREITLHCEGLRNRDVAIGVYGIRS